MRERSARRGRVNRSSLSGTWRRAPARMYCPIFAQPGESMDRLNCFTHFESKKENHEDALTRAFLLVLRLVPEAHADFLALVAANRQTKTPPLPDRVTLDKQEVVYETQTGSLSQPAKRLLSVLLTDKALPPVSVGPHPRVPVYDGVLTYGAEWVFIIENKPRHENVWKAQLSPSVKDVGAIEVEDTAVVVEWKDVVRKFQALVDAEGLSTTARAVVRDFLDYVYEEFAFLNPYDRLSLCRDSKTLVSSRCRLAMEELAPGRVHYHVGWKNYMEFDKASAQQVALDWQKQENGWAIVLTLNPGNTVRQARRLYAALDVEGLLALERNGWACSTGFHLAFRADTLVGMRGPMPFAEYVRFWQAHQQDIRQLPIDGERGNDAAFRKKVEEWVRLGLLAAENVDAVYEKTIRSKRTKVNVCPGLNLHFRWPAETAVALDEEPGRFVKEVQHRLEEAFRAWGQRLT